MTTHPQTRIGHVHLTVADLDRALAFYRDVLGFEVTARYGRDAVFLSAGGYHHHIGYNTWAGHLAPAPVQSVLGLRHFSVLLPDPAALEAVEARVRQAGLHWEQDGGARRLRDPSGIRLVLESGERKVR